MFCFPTRWVSPRNLYTDFHHGNCENVSQQTGRLSLFGVTSRCARVLIQPARPKYKAGSGKKRVDPFRPRTPSEEEGGVQIAIN